GDALHLARDRHTVHMAIKDIHENRDAGALHVAQSEFRRGRGLNDQIDHTIGGADDQLVALRGDTIGVAEEIKAPKRQDDTEPANRLPGQEETRPYGSKEPSAAMAFTMDRHED